MKRNTPAGRRFVRRKQYAVQVEVWLAAQAPGHHPKLSTAREVRHKAFHTRRAAEKFALLWPWMPHDDARRLTAMLIKGTSQQGVVQVMGASPPINPRNRAVSEEWLESQGWLAADDSRFTAAALEGMLQRAGMDYVFGMRKSRYGGVERRLYLRAGWPWKLFHWCGLTFAHWMNESAKRGQGPQHVRFYTDNDLMLDTAFVLRACRVRPVVRRAMFAAEVLADFDLSLHILREALRTGDVPRSAARPRGTDDVLWFLPVFAALPREV